MKQATCTAHTSSAADLPDQIWVTYKSRMNLEAKLIEYARASRFFLFMISFSLIVCSVFSGVVSSDHAEMINRTLICLSVLVFGASIALSTGGYVERANSHRQCYLQLQQLHRSNTDLETRQKEYDKILANYANHSERDYHDVVINEYKKSQKPIQIGGTPIYPNYSMRMYRWLRVAGFRVFYYGLPSVLLAGLLVLVGIDWWTQGRPQ